MKNIIVMICVALVLSGIILIPNALAENVPGWVKNTAGWWATDTISETEFVNAIEFLVKENIIQINVSQTSETSQSVPDWIKNTAGWWADDKIDDQTFLNAIEFLIKKGIVTLDKECKFFAEEYNLINEKHQKILCKFPNFDFMEFWYTPYEVESNEINALGFRGAEFSKIKPLDTYRIFMIGGSTVFGDGVENHNTIPSFLQGFYSNDKFENIKQIEVINAGINGGAAKQETDLIKNKISKMSPDLIIVYDGWNDSKIGNYGNFNWDEENDDETWKNRWTDICNSYNKEFDVVITLQPLITHKTLFLTDQEFTNLKTRNMIVTETENLDKLATHLNELNSTCNSAYDLRDIMKDMTSGVYYDQGHMTPTGNKIIANKIYEITLPIIEKNSQLILSTNDKKIEDEPKNHKTESNSKVDYNGKLIVGTDFSKKNISDIIAYFSIFRETDFSSSNIKNMDVKFSRFNNVDFSNAELQNSKISRSIFTNSDFRYADFSQSYFSTSTIINSDLTNSMFKNSDLRGVAMNDLVLENTNFENVDFSHSFSRNLDFTKTILQNSKLTGAYMRECVFDGTNFSIMEIEIHGDSLSPTEFVFCSMKDSNFSKIEMYNIDFTAKDILVDDEYVIYPGSDLSNSVFTNLDLRTTMFSMWSKDIPKKCKASDETVCKTIDYQEFFNLRFYIPINTDPLDLVRNTVSVKLEYSKFDNVNLSDNDLSVINLRHSQIIDSDLTNASFKHSDLSFSSIINSDLSGANLEGANLDGVTLDNVILSNANLKCINHPICESG